MIVSGKKMSTFLEICKIKTILYDTEKMPLTGYDRYRFRKNKFRRRFMKKKVSVFLFADALGWEIVEKYAFMHKQFPYRKEILMQFGYSSAAVPTVLSGKTPDKHGHFSFYYYDPQKSPFKILRFIPFAKKPRSIFNRGRVRSIISKIFARLAGYTGYFQLYNMPFSKIGYFNYCEKKDIFAKNGLAPECDNLRDILDAVPNLEYHISDWRAGDEKNLDDAEKLMLEGKTDFYFIYTASLDAFLHDNINNSDAIARRLDEFAAKVEKLIAALEKSGREFSFTIFSDHGMTPLKETSPVKDAVETLNLTFGKDYAACYDSTMARFYFFNNTAREQIQKLLNDKSFKGHFISGEEKKLWGIQFQGNKYGDEIFLLDPGIQIVPSDMGNSPLKGMHGFSPDDKDSAAAAISNTHIPEYVKSLCDYFELMKNAACESASEGGSL